MWGGVWIPRRARRVLAVTLGRELPFLSALVGSVRTEQGTQEAPVSSAHLHLLPSLPPRLQKIPTSFP